MKRHTITIFNFDICHPDYLLDHRNVIGVPLAGQTREQMADEILAELSSGDLVDIPEDVSDEDIRHAVISDLADNARFWPVDHAGDEIETDDLDDPRLQPEQPCAWFRVEITEEG